MKTEQIFDGVYKVDNKIATLNLVRGNRVYDEDLVEDKGKEYRLWNPYRSKLAAAIINGMREMRIKEGSNVLYLGAASGTTPSHVSDIVGKSGAVYCVEISERSVRDLVKLCEVRQNMLPILQDARNIEAYSEDVGTCDILYQDIAARDQAAILLRNSELLKKGGFAYVAIKSQSIDVSRNPKDVFNEFIGNISSRFTVLEQIDIAPYSRLHLFLSLQKK
jgi:fibrillarin-like pre-rRNA processing protein